MDKKYMWFTSFTAEQVTELRRFAEIIIDRCKEDKKQLSKRNTLPNEFNSLNTYITDISFFIRDLYRNGKVSSRGVYSLERQLRKISETIEKLKNLFDQRSSDNWMKGEPRHAMWCLVTYSPPDQRKPKVTRLWFNPSRIQKWRDRDTGVSYAFTGKVTHWMPVPQPASNDEG